MIAFDGALVAEMTEHARREFPNEACGLVASAGGRPVKVFPMRNLDASPSRFRLDPREQLEVFEEIARAGWDLFAIFHSHPRTAAYPSETDRHLARYPDAFHVVVSLLDPDAPEVRAFRLAGDAVAEEEVAVA